MQGGVDLYEAGSQPRVIACKGAALPHICLLTTVGQLLLCSLFGTQVRWRVGDTWLAVRHGRSRVVFVLPHAIALPHVPQSCPGWEVQSFLGRLSIGAWTNESKEGVEDVALGCCRADVERKGNLGGYT
jgi:hypothetical protein